MTTQPPITMYARERDCPDVWSARDRLSELGLTWDEHDIDADPQAAGVVQALTGQRRVPTLIIGTAVLVEPSATALDDALRAAGYEVPPGSEQEQEQA